MGRPLVSASDEPDEETWQARDMGETRTLIVGEPPDILSYPEFWELRLKRGITVRHYQAEDANAKDLKIEDEEVENEEELETLEGILWTDQYDSELGVQL